ncbi:MAG TPA: glycosyltransferase family 2 protein, partial [Acidimicrobiales bacterium]|nr:glycosyltransferase family 2 protein [Acidimicrobiales bacterium]
MAVQRRPSAGHLVQPGLGELWSLAAPDLELSVVIPYYNPGTRLRTTVERLLTALADAEVTFEVIAVSDGSTDGSPDALEDLRSMAGDAVRHVRLGRNGGKGQALQVGLAMGRGAYLGFIDADGDLAPELLGSFVSLMRSDEPDIILGS